MTATAVTNVTRSGQPGKEQELHQKQEERLTGGASRLPHSGNTPLAEVQYRNHHIHDCHQQHTNNNLDIDPNSPPVVDSDHQSTSTIEVPAKTADDEPIRTTIDTTSSSSPTSSSGIAHSHISSAKPSPLRRFSAWVLNHHHRHQPIQLDRGGTEPRATSTTQQTKGHRRQSTNTLASSKSSAALKNSRIKTLQFDIDNTRSPLVILEAPTPTRLDAPVEYKEQSYTPVAQPALIETENEPLPVVDKATAGTYESANNDIDADDLRRQSLVDSVNAQPLSTLIASPSTSLESSQTVLTSRTADNITVRSTTNKKMSSRKIWVKRPGGSATLVAIQEDDLVDDARDTILRKYANSLGRAFDAPDMIIRLTQRMDHGGSRLERVLGPEEDMCSTIDLHYPGGQTVDEALIVDVPQRRTPKPSPKVYHHTAYHAVDDYRPLENDTGYFPPMPAFIPQTISQTAGSHESRASQHHPAIPLVAEHPPRSMSVLNTGAVPPLPSPGGRRRYPEHHRPRFLRNPTSSTNVGTHPHTSVPAGISSMASVNHLPNRHRGDSSASETLLVPSVVGNPPAPLPTPPVLDALPIKNGSTPPTPSGITIAIPQQALPSTQPRRPRKHRKSTPDRPGGRAHHKHSASSVSNAGLAASMLDGSVPPINVLIVEDNVINLRILEGLMKRLKVRWQTAVNGQIGVDKWKAGGFHLVLMDIQMPVMNGLQATKEIRRLERVNGIGVFSSASDEASGEVPNGETPSELDKEREAEKDRLDASEGRFKSPVIIVALTASSLQSDRHEALAAGCNDFLTKPVDFVWLERKVKEWGCMQALIDFDGWRKWKDYAEKEEAGKTEEQKRAEQAKAVRMQEKMAKLQEKQRARKEEEERKKREAAAATASATSKVEDTKKAPADDGATHGVAEASRPDTAGP